MNRLCDMHTHTVFGDGSNTPEEMVLAAIQKGLRTLGLSEHAHADFPGAEEWCMSLDGQKEYACEVSRLKDKYSDRIKVMLGAETDYYSTPIEFEYDYLIGSVHMLKKDGEFFALDLSPNELKNAVDMHYSSDAMLLVKDYYELVASVVNKTKCDIIGHFDLVTKFNEKHPLFDTTSHKYRDMALSALDALLEYNIPFEINTGAISRGWKSNAYPEEFLLRRIAEKNGAVIINSDAHSAKNICFDFEAAEEYARFCGIKNFAVY